MRAFAKYGQDRSPECGERTKSRSTTLHSAKKLFRELKAGSGFAKMGGSARPAHPDRVHHVQSLRLATGEERSSPAS